MKRILSIIAAGALALLAFSCAKEEDKAVIDTTQTTPPVLVSAAVADNVTVQFTPAVFQMGFNEKMATFHTLGMVSVNGNATNVTLSTKVDGNTITLTGKNLTNALKARGFKPLEEVAVELVVRASIQDPAKGVTNGYVDSNEKYPFTWTMPEESEQQGCPYEDFTEDSNWSLIGSMEAYGISWDGDLNMWTDGTTHVAAHVTLKAGDEVKFRQDQSWTVNMGGDFGGLDAEFAVTQDGVNIKVGADGVYDLYLDPAAGTAWVTAAFDPYPDYTEESNWSVIGALSLYGISWDGDIPMVSDGSNHAAFAVALDAADEFKFRQDKAWTVNLGGDFAGVGAEIAVSQDGPNIKVGAAGVFDLFVNPDAGTALVAEASGLKISAKIGGDEPEPQPVEVKGWNIIGLNGDWENDILATEKDNVWTAYITAEDETEFKWRKDAGWDENYGGVMVAFGEPFDAVAGGDNIKVAAGFYMVKLDLTNADAPKITVFNDFTVWSLIGVNGDWNTDIDMSEADGKWVSPATKISGEFKLRKNHGWDDNRGGKFEELGKAFAVTNGGDNINVPEGEYIVTYDPAAETVVVDAALPSNTWSLIGVNGDWNNDIFMTEVVPGVWVSPEIETTTDWKVRFNHGWDVNRGAAAPSAAGEFVKAVPNGSNVNITGKFQVVFNANNETIGTLGWGVIGTITGWGADVPMNLAADGKWYSVPVALTADDEIKIREKADWGVNRGGACTAANEAFAVTNGGDNIKAPAAGTYMVVYDPTAETITLSTHFWGLIGDFNSWGGDKFMLFDGYNWVAYGQTLAGGWKIREGADWGNNRGGVFAAVDTPFDAVANGDNINVGELAGFDVLYNPAAEAFFIGDAANYVAPAAGGILIDGDMSDWDEIEGVEQEPAGQEDVEEGAASITSVKGYADADNVYVYIKRDKVGRWKKLWGGDADKVGYYYYDFDMDNNPETGEKTEGSHGNWEGYCYLYIFGGTYDAPVFRVTPPGSGSGVTISNVTCAGIVTETAVETEISFPRADLPAITGDTITVGVWGNKDAVPFTKVTFKVQ
ncbi:MAG: hypothetical protein IK074_01155 [Bacteroidales bacterium]|nr:hypothetical protein [Bacteroidales bacterium]